jgi:hypothetical protein
LKIQCWIGLLLLAGLVAGAAAAEGSIPSLPHEFYGTVTIGGALPLT